jgi:GntR family transcriptional regulator
VRQALAELRAQGLLVTRPGAGSYVTHGSAPVKPVNFIGYLEDVILQAAGMKNTVVRIEEIEPSVLVRDRLRLRSTARVLLIERTRASKGEPLFHAFNYLPARFGRRLDRRDLPTRSLTELLPASCGIAVTGAAQSFTATGAPPDVAAYLGLEPGAPTLYTEIVMYAGRLPIVLSVAYYRPDRALFTAHLTTLAGGNAASTEAERAS